MSKIPLFPNLSAILASILGGYQLKTMSSGGDDYNNYADDNYIVISGNNATKQNSPSSVGISYGTTICSCKGNYKYQQTYGVDNGKPISAIRFYTAEGVWTPWVRTDNFGCSTPSDLASLLGANGKFSSNNDVNEIGYYIRMTGSISGGAPESFCFVISWGDANASLCFQIAIGNSGDFYFRYYWSTWHSWHKIALQN